MKNIISHPPTDLFSFFFVAWTAHYQILSFSQLELEVFFNNDLFHFNNIRFVFLQPLKFFLFELELFIETDYILLVLPSFFLQLDVVFQFFLEFVLNLLVLKLLSLDFLVQFLDLLLLFNAKLSLLFELFVN